MDFFSGLKKAYDKIESEMSKSLNPGEDDSTEQADGDEEKATNEVDKESEPVSQGEFSRGISSKMKSELSSGWEEWEGPQETTVGSAPSVSTPRHKPGQKSMNSTPKKAKPSTSRSPVPSVSSATAPKQAPDSGSGGGGEIGVDPVISKADTSTEQTLETPKTPTAGKTPNKTQLESLSREDLVKYVKKQAQVVLKLKARNEELSKESRAKVEDSQPTSQTDLAPLMEELQILKTQNDQKSEEHRQLRQTCTQLRSERDDLVCQVDTLSTKLTCTQHLLREDQEASEQRIEVLTQELDESKSHCQLLTQQVKEIEVVKKSDSESDEWKGMETELKESTLALQEQQEKSKKRELELKKHIKRLTVAVEESKNEKKSLEQKSGQLERQLEVKSEEFDSSTSKFEAQQVGMDKLREEADTLSKVLKERQDQFSDQHDKLTAAEEEVNTLKKSLAELQTQRQELREESSETVHLREELESAGRLLSESRSHETELNERAEENNELIESLRKSLAELQVQEEKAVTLTEENRKLSSELQSVKALLEQSQVENQDAKDDSTEKDRLSSEQIEALKAKVADLISQEKSTQEMADKHMDMFQQLSRKHEELQSQVMAQTTTEKEDCNEEDGTIKSELKALQASLLAKEEELDSMRKKRDECLKDLQNAQLQFEETHKALETRLVESSHVTSSLEEEERREVIDLKSQCDHKMKEVADVREMLEKEIGLRADLQKQHQSQQEDFSAAVEERERLEVELREIKSLQEDEMAQRTTQHEQLLCGREDEVKALKAKSDDLCEQLSTLGKSHAAVCHDLESAQDSNRDLLAKITGLEQTVQDNEVATATHASVVEELRKHLEGKENSVRSESLAKEEKINELSEKCESAHTENKALQGQLEEMSSQLSEKSEEVKTLENRLSKITLSYDEVAGEVEEKRCKVTQLEAAVEGRRSECEDLRSQLRQTKERLVHTEKGVKASNLIDLELADYQYTVSTLETRLSEKGKELEENRVVLSQKEDSCAQLKQSLNGAEEAKRKTEERMGKMKGLLVKTKNELAETRKKEAESEKTVSQLTAQVEDERLAAEDVKVQVAEMVVKLEASAQSYQSSLESLRATQKKLENRGCTLQEDLQAAKEALKAKEEEFQSYKVRAQSVLKQKTAGPNTKNMEEEMRQSYEGQISSLQQDLQTTSDRLNSVLSDMEDLTEEHSQLARRHEQLLDEYTDARDEWKKKQKEVISHHKSVEGNKEEVISQLRQEIQHTSQAYKDQIASVQKEHRLMLDGLKDKLHSAQNDLIALQQQKQQQQQQKKLSSSNPSQVVTSNRSFTDLSQLQFADQVAGQLSHSDSVTSESETKVTSSSSTPMLSLEKLLSTNLSEATAPVPMSPSSLTGSMPEGDLKQQLASSDKRIEHLTEVLGESEATSMRLADQAKLLKEEIRRLERNREREESVSSLEYLKNVVLKFLHTESEQEQLLPVIANLLKLSQSEKAFLEQVIKGKNPSLPELAKGESPHSHGNKEKGWSSYIHRWTGY